jgi:hypothetical protein
MIAMFLLLLLLFLSINIVLWKLNFGLNKMGIVSFRKQNNWHYFYTSKKKKDRSY